MKNIENSTDTALFAEKAFAGSPVITSTAPFRLPEVIEGELAPSHLEILRTLAVNGPEKMSGIGKRVGASHAMMTHLTDQLEGKKLIERVRSDKDRRLIHLRPTATGRELIKRLRALYSSEVSSYLDEMDPDERGDFISSFLTLEKIASKYSST